VRKISLSIALILSCIYGISQTTGTITGKVLDKSNNAISGVTIAIDGANKGKTDVDGRYTIVLPAGTYTFLLSSVGYKETSEKVEIKAGVIIDLDFILEIKKKNEDVATVKAAPSSGRKETVNAGIQFQKNTNTVASIITAESIKRSPDRNTGEVLKRTPGTSIQEGKFLVVRGLADRYNQAMLNGILLTSTEPDRKTFSFDIIPSAMIDNLVINKAFVPEYPGEWAGGLIQVNTKDIPTKNFFTIQVGTGFNSQTLGKQFYGNKAGKLDWLGIEDGTRNLPEAYITKNRFDTLNFANKTAIGKSMRNDWEANQINTPANLSFESNGGFKGKLFNKTVGGIFGLIYKKNNSFQDILNRHNNFDNGREFKGTDIDFNDDRYVQNISLGALASLSIQLNSANKIGVKTIANVNTTNSTNIRNGIDDTRNEDIKGNEFTFKQNTFFTTQLNGTHTLSKALKFNWNGAFSILDGYNPDQRRILYARDKGTSNPYKIILSNTLSQSSGSRIYQILNDYIYTTGGDLTYTFKNKQTIKGGYMFQVRDRLFDAKLFANYLPTDNSTLRLLSANQAFAPQNFGNGTDNKIAFDAIKGSTFRYMANTILNAGYIQMDNTIFEKLRVVYGVRVENFDQLVGSVKKWDPRHTYSVVTDFLPGLNATYKINEKTNFRFSASQTVIRPELRELSALNLYDFELNASVQGNPNLQRTKVTNLDLRYELYNKPGEIFTLGAFYKFFKNPIEQIFNEGSGGASTFNYQNADKAYSAGIEFEMRKKLDVLSANMKNFTFQSNLALIKSRVSDAALNLDRSLQGQSNYLVNVGLLYDAPKKGLNATLLFNLIGERIFLVGDKAAGSSSPDVYEAPRPLLDFQLAKKIIKGNGEIKMNISDILNKVQYFYQNANASNAFQKVTDAYRFTRRFGTGFNFSFSYTL
jgi:TonB-dependent receptor